MLPQPPLNPNSPLPLYHQLSEIVREWIEDGRYSPGDHLPTEDELARTFAVSRATVREAMRGLSGQGLIEIRRGKGAYVARKKIPQALPGLSSFTKEMGALGFSVTSKVLEKEIIAPPARILNALKLDKGSRVLRVMRQRFVDGAPMVVSVSHLIDKISIDHDFSGSLYKLLEEVYGYKILTGEASVDAGLADRQCAALLNLKPGEPVLRITWLARTDSDLPVEYSEATFRAGNYRYVIRLGN